MKTADLIIDSSEKNADLYYATGFLAPDPYIYFKVDGRSYVMMSDLEIDRARKTAKVSRVLSLSKYTKMASTPKKAATKLDAVALALRERGVKRLRVPQSMSFVDVEYLKKHFKVEPGPLPFYPERMKKGKDELKEIEVAQRFIFKAMAVAEEIIGKASIKDDKLYLDGEPLTSERVRSEIELFLYRNGFITTDGTIVACGNDSIDPHNFGSGVLRPNRPIIVDIFPRSKKSLFFGDATRTFCKGRAPEELKRLYATVKEAQEEAIRRIRPGVNGQDIHKWILSYFEKKGYKTGEMGGRMQGFFHSTGHGIGLELHEAPLRIGPVDFKLEAGFVTSVEPGLYYKKIGGVRIEDLVYITKGGAEVIGRYPKRLEIE